MHFNVADLLKGPTGSKRLYDIDDAFEPLDETGVFQAKGSVKLTRTNGSVLVSANLYCTAKCTCSRCLEGFSMAIHITLEEEYFPTLDIATGRRLKALEPSEGDAIIDDHHIIDLTEAVRQYALVGLPMKPLCSDNCRGLCTECGMNLNESRCLCNHSDRDPKWEPLLKALVR